MSYTPRPHISSALQHLRFGVTASAVALALCLATQIVVWSVVHYTEVRVETLEPATHRNPLQVVRAESAEPVVEKGAKVSEKSEKAEKADAAPLVPAAPAEPNQVAAASDLILRRVSALTQSFGVIFALLFGALVFQGVTIAGGAAAPGVEKAVTAGSWALAIVLLSLPLGSMLPTLPYAGVFVSYDDMVRASDAYRSHHAGAPGALGFFGSNLVLPFMAIAAIGLVVLRFRSGVEAGIIVTNMSQLDEKLEREIRAMKLGQLSQPRALGALHSALGSSPEGEPSAPRASTAFNEAPARQQRPLGAPTAVENDPDLERLADGRRRPI